MINRNPLGGFAGMLEGKHVITQDQADGPQEGTVTVVDTMKSEVYVIMNKSSFSEGSRFGPAPYCVGVADPPQVGDTALVVFIGQGIDRPRIVSWWR